MDPCARCILLTLFMLFNVCMQNVSSQDILGVKILNAKADGNLGKNATVSCFIRPSDITVQWTFKDEPIVIDGSKYTTSIRNISRSSDQDGNRLYDAQAFLHIDKTTAAQHGLYGCVAMRGEDIAKKPVMLNLTIPVYRTGHSVSPAHVRPSTSTTLTCTFQGFNLTEVKWRKGNNMSMKFTSDRVSTENLNETHVIGTLKIIDVNRKDNGTYLCGVRDHNDKMVIFGLDVLVLEAPQVSIDFIKAVGARKIYLNWTLNDGNSPVESNSLQLRKNGSETWTYHSVAIPPRATAFVVTDLEPDSQYQLKLMAKNGVDWGKPYADHRWIKTLEQDPQFIPDVVVKGFTMSSVTVGWSPPPEALAEYVHFYELTARKAPPPESATPPSPLPPQPPTIQAVHQGDERNLPYMFENLTPDTTYIFQVRSCSELTKECGNWSTPVNGTTMDGVSGPVADPSLVCRHDNISGANMLHLEWQPPVTPNGKITHYDVEVSGNASFLNSEGVQQLMQLHPKSRHVQAISRSTRFDNVPPNTNFTVRIYALTRSRKNGQPVTLGCVTPPSAPPRDLLQGFRWDKVREYDGRWLFRLFMPRVSERNGAICCYRVFVVRMRNEQRLSDLPSPEHLAVSSYAAVHSNRDASGAYIAEIFTSDSLQTEVILGDGATQNAGNVRSLRQCIRCSSMATRRVTITTTTTTTTTSTTTEAPTKPQPMLNTVAEPSGVTNLLKDVEATSSPVTQIPEEVEEIGDASTEGNESDKSRLLKKKKKMKRHFPNDSTQKKLSLHDLQEYQNMQPYSDDNIHKESVSNYNDERKFTLDEEFFINRRIYHQNKPKLTEINKKISQIHAWNEPRENTINQRFFKDNVNDYIREELKSDDSLDLDEDDVVWTNNDEEDIEDAAVSLKDDTFERRQIDRNFEPTTYLGKHKIIARNAEQSLYESYESSHDDYSQRNLKYASLNRPVRQIENSEEFSKLMKDLATEGSEITPQNRGFNERVKKLNEKKEKEQLAWVAETETEGADGETAVGIEFKKVEKKDDVREGSGMMLDSLPVVDGQLDIDSNYTGFVELLVHSEGSQWTPVYSNYFSVLNPGPDELPVSENYMLEIVLKVVCGFVGVALLLVLALCAMQARSRRKAPHQAVEMNALQTTLRSLYQGLRGGRHQLVSPAPPDLPPISRDDLLSAYTERQNDSGYGFQHEFEMLPDCFPDRTMEASESKENQGKNRYPDIKAYDQTRVKLSLLDGIIGSDYINANFVLGYKERKKFICAQGPTDVTVDDFWRMIWEHSLDLVVMLTNLEEYSKVKCAKYWPDQHTSHKLYASYIHVQHVSEKRYSDYIIRELRISRQPPSSPSSQLIEANGVKKNGVGEVTNGNGAASGANEERTVRQYHFLMWKDFVAPEHPHAILKFIKRVREASAGGRTALVHCSAGVGRTGTLVALDCLLEQLTNEGEVAVFNTVCDLRRQRNFLVQSLKQYIFVYRALLEYAQYGDTEIPASKLKTTVDRLRQTAENCDSCAMEDEFEKMKQSFLEQPKACAAGRAPESAAKNRSETVVPYDHNRVILAPIATKEHSTYMNASFIQGYDNSESYIIAQDPLPSTIADFWRMVSEQEISTIVMLSELGEGKCPRYWDDEEIQYDHINVNYVHNESCPYYTRREFQVTNTKNQERINVTQLQYHGWPTVSGQVPEVTRGLIELVGQSGASPPASPPMLVHCSLGTDRSSMFVALSILITQLRTERRVDVSTVSRKLRSQRMGCLDTFLQYEFLHRAIVNYAELHDLLTDS